MHLLEVVENMDEKSIFYYGALDFIEKIVLYGKKQNGPAQNKMIKTLKIKNFECWQEAELAFDPGVNVIIAKPGIKASDCGKSSLIRAIRWAAENQPAGDEIRSWWAGKEETSSILTFPEGKVERFRTKSQNRYILNDKEFSAFGKKIPEEIAGVVNFTDLNIQRQVDSFFLLKETSGEVARYLNRVVNLTKIDSSQTYAKSKVTEADRQIKFLEGRVTQEKEKLAGYDWLPKAEKEFAVLKKEQLRLDTVEARLSRLDTLLYNIEQARADVSRYENIPNLKRQVELCISGKEDIQAREVKLQALGLLIHSIKKTKKEITGHRKVTKLRSQLEECMEVALVLKNRERKLDQLDKLLYDIEGAIGDVQFTTRKYELARAAFEKAFPAVCPLCGQEVK